MAPVEYRILTVPGDTPVTIPVPEVTDAMPVLVLVQVPPDVASLNVMDDDAHTPFGPVIAAGAAPTVTVTADLQYALIE